MKSGKFHLSRKKIITIVVLVAIVAALFYFWSKAGAAARARMIPAVQVTTLKKTSLQDSVSLSGTIQSNTSQNVYTTLNYPIKEVNVKVGDVVKAGQTLAVLDTDSLAKDVESTQYSTKYAQDSARLSLQKAKADYDNALSLYNKNQNADLINAKAAVTSTQQDLNTEKDNYNYNQYLYNTGELSKMALDQEKAKLTSAQSAYDKAVATLTSTQNQVQQNLKTLKNAYDQALAKSSDKSQDVALEKQQQNLKDGVITAPADGSVTVLNAVVGAAANGILFTVEDTNDLIINTEVKEYDVDQVTVGKKVIIKTDATGDKEIAGVVTRIAPAATASTQGTNNVTFAAEIKVTDHDPGLKIGMKARMNIVISEKSDIYAVPYDAVLHKGDGSAYVLAAVKDASGYKAKEIPVQTGLENDISIEVSGSGISDGVQIVSNPENISAGSALKL
jgi:Multidrug resistance efflux pump